MKSLVPSRLMALSKAGSRWYIPLAPKGVRPGCLLRKPPDGIDRRLRALAKFVPASLFCKGAQWFIAGWSSPVARQAHNLKVIGSNPIPATTFVITHSPSRSNRRDRFSFSGETQGPGDGAGPAACSVTRFIRSEGWTSALDRTSREATLSRTLNQRVGAADLCRREIVV